MNNRQTYVPLRVRSSYSLLKGVSSVDELLAEATCLGYGTMGLTDENNLYGVLDFVDSARDRGIRPIIGSIVSDADHSVLALVENQTGYENLCKMITQKRLGQSFDLMTAMGNCQDGLLFLVRNPEFARFLIEVIEPKRLWLECCRPMPRRWEGILWDMARDLRLPVVATTNVFYATQSEAETHRLVTAVRQNCLLDEVPKVNPKSLNYLPSLATVRRLFSDCPKALKETMRIADRCRFKPRLGKKHFPSIPNARERLVRETLDGMGARFDRATPEVSKRLDEELDVIMAMGYADYFLVVADIVRHARSLGTPVAGRGSGANSLVAYCLGITNVDPLKYDLPFARFLNRGRTDYPDLDLDFCWKCRDAVIDYVFDTYGAEHVAMVSTMNTMTPRAAFRFAAKALGHCGEATSRMQRILSTIEVHDLENPDHSCWRAMGVARDAVMAVVAESKKLFDKPHHLALHPGGVVVTPDPITTLLPVEPSAKGVPMTQLGKEAAQQLGLVKIDLLGNRALSAAGEAIQLIKEGHGIDLDVETLTDVDEKTAALLRTGNTLGIGQLESPLMRRLLVQVQAESPRDVMQALALVRPGSASLDMKERFIRRKRGVEKVPNLEPKVDAVLRETQGIMVFEDDVLRVACALAGLDAADGDRFRKRVGRCETDAEREALSIEFLDRCTSNGVDLSVATDLWIQMSLFNGYSFCRAHAASYARLAWFNAFVKAHYPLEFWVAALNNTEGVYDKWVYVEEAKRQGITILPPCVNRSQSLTTVEAGAIRLGLMQVRGLSRPSQQSIIDNRPFKNRDDFLERTTLKKPELESLERCGMLDALDPLEGESPREPQSIRSVGPLEGESPREPKSIRSVGPLEGERTREPKSIRSVGPLEGERTREPKSITSVGPLDGESPLEPQSIRSVGPLEGERTREPQAPSDRGVKEFPNTNIQTDRLRAVLSDAVRGYAHPPTIQKDRHLTPDTFRAQWEILGLSIAQHPLTPFRSFLKANGFQKGGTLHQHVGTTVKVCGIPATSRSVRTNDGQDMCFYTLSDEDGLFEVAVPAGLYQRIKLDLVQVGNHALCVTAIVEAEFGAVTCRATELVPLERVVNLELERCDRRAG